MKIIKVNSCASCPFFGKCEAWKKLSSAQRINLSLGVGLSKDFILNECHLEDDPNYMPEPCKG